MNINLLYQKLPFLLGGAVTSINIAIISCFIGITLGSLIGIILTTRRSLITVLLEIVTGIIRGTPMLIQIFMAYHVLPQCGFIMLPAFWTATIAIGINSAAYISMIVKAGIASVSKGQIEAAKTLGLNYTQIARYIILPQAFKTVFPAIGNELITLIKDSSLASTIGVMELSRRGSQVKSDTFDAITVFTGICLIYLCMTGIATLLVSLLEKRINKNYAQH